MREKVIITGSKGLIGSELTDCLSKIHDVIELDIQLGHDLSNEKFVIDFFLNNPAEYLVNCFAINDHVKEGEEREINLFNIPLDTIHAYLNINTVAMFSVCREFSKNPLAKSIINFASTYSLVSANPVLYNGKEKNIAYVISKAAVPQLTRHLAVHLAPQIRVNCVIPHGIENNQGADFKRRFTQLSPSGRMMRKDELNGIIKLLCSDNSTYITGSIITVDGGWTAW
jgi:NAD(P)-dependent dehydrogenase (short-subunit alcohol dehydrogenase family)